MCTIEFLCEICFLNVTTDKVYHNNEWERGYRENDPLDGYDPHSNSKSCSEISDRTVILIHFLKKTALRFQQPEQEM